MSTETQTQAPAVGASVPKEEPQIVERPVERFKPHHRSGIGYLFGARDYRTGATGRDHVTVSALRYDWWQRHRIDDAQRYS